MINLILIIAVLLITAVMVLNVIKKKQTAALCGLGEESPACGGQGSGPSQTGFLRPAVIS